MDETQIQINGNPPQPFFGSLEEKWMFLSDVTDDLYKTMHLMNRLCAALAYVSENTTDMETMRYLARKCWQHFHERDDQAFDEYYESPEYEQSEQERMNKRLNPPAHTDVP
jgi:hypothetical protein